MADVATDAAAATDAPPSLGASYDKAISGLQAAERGEKKALQGAEKDISRLSAPYQAQMQSLIKEEGATLNDLKHPWNTEQELKKHDTSLWEAFGSPGFIMAMIGSSFSARPMNSALTAGGAAMAALKKNDNDAYERAFEAWKENSDLAIKRMNIEHQQFQDISHLRETNFAEYQAQLRAKLATFGNDRALALLDAGLNDKVEEAIGKIPEIANQVQEATDRLNVRKLAQQSLQENEEYQKGNFQKKFDMQLEAEKKIQETYRYGRGSAGVAEKIKTMEEIKADVRKEHPDFSPGQVDLEAARRIKEANAPPITGNKRVDMEAHIGQYDDALKIIDKVEDTLNRYVGAAGLAGKAGRLKERLENMAGLTKADQSDRVQMMRDIEQLQLMMPQLLLDRTTGRPLSAEAALVRDIVAGLQVGDTNANTLRAMHELHDRLVEIQKRAKERLPGKPDVSVGEPTETPPPASEPSWDDFPEAK